jgi:integrase
MPSSGDRNAMSKLDQYIHAATRDNTRQSYQSAIRHFEVDWGGFLPATADSIARYLADHAGTLSINTLRQRLAALAQWHIEQGFPDPTKAPVVRKVLRGIQALHPAQEKQAKPLQLDQLDQVAKWLDAAIEEARVSENRAIELRHTRDRALLLLGFWRGFRGDELTRLLVEHVDAVAGEGMTCYFPRTKGDRAYQGTTFKAPALARLCPVEAYLAWKDAAQLVAGPVFRAVDRWGHIRETGLHIDSLLPLLRTTLADAGIAEAELYSGHSLRRGFANWATANGWDLKTLMEYVGWKNVRSAMRYVDAADPFGRHRIEKTLHQGVPAARLTNHIQDD